MGRKRPAPRRAILPDAKYNNLTVSKFVSRMMYNGKRSVSERILYDALEIIRKKGNDDPLGFFLKALANVKPAMEVRSRRVGGSTYQVPVDIRPVRQEALAMRWIISAARNRSGKSMSQALSTELTDGYNATGTAFKKKEDTHKMAEANKAFSHYRW